MNALTRKSAVIYLVGVFVVGSIAGTAAGYRLGRRQPMRPPPTPEKMSSSLCDRFTRDLNLRPDQVEKIKPIIRETTDEIERFRKGSVQQIGDIIRKSHERMAVYLDADQRTRLEEMDREHERRKSRSAGRGP
jgi:hypothetical protein